MITVKVFAPLGYDLDRSRFNTDLTVKLDLTDATLAEVIDQMVAQYGVKVKDELLDEEGNLDYIYGIFSDEARVADLDTRIQDGSEVDIVMMMGGSCSCGQ